MQWWIINLEDGFSETEGKMVPLDVIASIPMLALWRGIVAFLGKAPELTARDFCPSSFQATSNRNLEPAMASNFAEKNYFMISKHFCTNHVCSYLNNRGSSGRSKSHERTTSG